MLESRGRIDEHYAVDGECRGGDRATKRDDPRDDREHAALLAGQNGVMIRRAATPPVGPGRSARRLLRTGPRPKAVPGLDANRTKPWRALPSVGGLQVVRLGAGCSTKPTRLCADGRSTFASRRLCNRRPEAFSSVSNHQWRPHGAVSGRLPQHFNLT